MNLTFKELKHPLPKRTLLEINKIKQETIKINDWKWNSSNNLYVYDCIVIEGNKLGPKILTSESPHYIRNIILPENVKNENFINKKEEKMDNKVYNESELTPEELILVIYNDYCESLSNIKTYDNVEKLKLVLFFDKEKKLLRSYEYNNFQYNLELSEGELGKCISYIPKNENNSIIENKVVCYEYKKFFELINSFGEYDKCIHLNTILENDVNKNIKLADMVYYLKDDVLIDKNTLIKFVDNLPIETKREVCKNYIMNNKIDSGYVIDIKLTNNGLYIGVNNELGTKYLESKDVYNLSYYSDNKDKIIEKIMEDIFKNS